VHYEGLRGRWVIRWMAGLAVAALLVGGGVALGANLTGANGRTQASLKLVGSAAVKNAAIGALSGTGLKHDLAGLRTCLRSARQLARSGHHPAARAERRACLRRYHARGLLLLRRLLISGEHGQITLKAKHGTRTVAFERGVVQTVTSGSVVVKAPDGTTMTWHLVSKTAVLRVQKRAKDRSRIRGKNRTIDAASASALAAGQRVFAVGAVVGGTDDARLIIIRG
jgi:hypothetical protein